MIEAHAAGACQRWLAHSKADIQTNWSKSQPKTISPTSSGQLIPQKARVAPSMANGVMTNVTRGMANALASGPMTETC